MQVAHYFFACCKNVFYAALAGFFLVFVHNFPKYANYEEFLAKFVNTNFLHGVLILSDAKKYSQHEEIFEA